MQGRALVTPQADFWLLGGLSIVILGPIWMITTSGDTSWTPLIVSAFIYLMFIFGYSHIAYSYLLFYKDFRAYLSNPKTAFGNKIRLYVAGVVTPAVLVLLFAYVVTTHNLSLLISIIYAYFTLSGWHYVKQGYGVLITTSVYKRIFYSEWQKRILYMNAYIVWMYTSIKFYSLGLFNNTMYDVSMPSHPLPAILLNLSFAAFCISSALAGGVILKVWLIEKKGVTLNGVTGYISACYIWRTLIYLNPVLALCVPLFHGLQYMPFVYKFKKNSFEDDKKSYSDLLKESNITTVQVAVFIGVGIFLGALMFQGIPNLIDRLNGPMSGLSKYFFAIAFVVFVNIHHNFIDHVFWRKDNEKVQKFLFSA